MQCGLPHPSCYQVMEDEKLMPGTSCQKCSEDARIGLIVAEINADFVDPAVNNVSSAYRLIL